MTPDAGGNVTFSYVHPEGANLVADYTGFLMTIETEAAPTTPSAEQVLAGDIPFGTVDPVRQLLVASNNAPQGRAYAWALIRQAEELLRHVEAVHGAALVGDIASVDRHLEHAFTIVEGVGGPNYRDFDGDGQIIDPGDGFGIVNYADEIEALAQSAAGAPDATPNVVLRAEQITTLTENVRTWALTIVDTGIAAHQATTANDQLAATEEMVALSMALLAGVDANGNGSIEPVPGEGGAINIYHHAQYMAAMGLQITEE